MAMNIKTESDNSLSSSDQDNNKKGSLTLNDRIIFYICIGISLLHIYFNIFAVLPSLMQNSLHYAGFILAGVLLYPISIKSKNQGFSSGLKIIDIFWGLLASFSAIYMIAREDLIYDRGVSLDTSEWIFGIILIISAIEFTRRSTGPIIPVLIILALTYISWWGEYVTGVFNFSGLSVETILFRSIFGDDGIFGMIASISSTFVFMFILFGAFLLKSGAGDFVVDLSKAVAGRLIGGPGFVAVIASALTGTISGSSVANTASTGVITIPLMQKAGFPSRFAAATEAAASTGGQLMPPIMGAGAFIMANFTQIPYTTIIVVSFLPAVLYFLTVGFFVRVEAKRSACSVTTKNTISLFELTKKRGLPFILPVSILLGLLMVGYTPTYAAGLSIIAVVVSSWFSSYKMGFRLICEALALGAKNMVMTAILLCSVGLVINVIATAGIGNTFSHMIVSWAGDSALIALILIALASLVLGMGLPVTASYIVLGTLSAPALFNIIADGQLVQAIANGQIPDQAMAVFALALPDKIAELGVQMPLDAARLIVDSLPGEIISTVREQVLSPTTLSFSLLSAHMIIFWLSQDSAVTPPVCLTAFTAAAIAKTPPMATGFVSWKIAKGLYIIPLLFAYTNFIGGPWIEVLSIFGFAVFGLYALVGFLEGYLESPLNIVNRILLGGVALALLYPSGILVHFAGLIFLLVILIKNTRNYRKS